MMSGDNFTDGLHKTRPVLGDLTNGPVKRGFLSTSGDLGLNKFGKNVASEYGDSSFAKQVCLGVENMVKGKCKTVSDVDNGNDRKIRESCVSSVLVPECSTLCLKEGEGRISVDVTQRSNVAHKGGLVSCVGSSNEDLGVGRLAWSKYGSIEWSRLPRSQGSRSFVLERCAGLQANGCANLNAGADFVRACSCSFCMKAAYIWSDLHYQDIKGRIAVLKKSRKEANYLVQKNGMVKGIDIHVQGNSSKPLKLESDLTGQWRSLFLQMEDIFVHESSQLQASFLALKDLRENCKMDLERTTERQ
ncbi:hypothetical protein CFOL_v3_28183 [Cephalotus follicularis]|uniref:Uncharacterized protein n=1 Tax=Cephalotus follicularis TaxID=3775 RepID=A0A1Q3CX69_CEPFO|nr:hypothetical protein CFOL_v3_28183 [Cephalotus follicularis]